MRGTVSWPDAQLGRPKHRGADPGDRPLDGRGHDDWAGSRTRARKRELPSAVGVRTQVFVDRSRNTPSDSVAGIAPDNQRRLPTTIFYPARGTPTPNGTAVEKAKPRGGKFPLVIFNGGSPGAPEDYAPLLAEWAAAGYVVAAPEFPISSLAGPDDVAWKDLPRQSGDARFVLDRVLALDEKKTGIAEIDDDHIGVAGHSFGGATALSLIANCCRDRRFDAALVLAAVTETTDGPQLKGSHRTRAVRALSWRSRGAVPPGVGDVRHREGLEADVDDRAHSRVAGPRAAVRRVTTSTPPCRGRP